VTDAPPLPSPPAVSLLSEWFVARRGLANGVVFAGTAIGGLIIPFLLEFLLSRYGAPITLRALVSPELALADDPAVFVESPG